MIEKWDFVATLLVLALIALGVSGYFVALSIPWPATWEAWLVGGENTKAPVEALALVLAPAGAVAGLIGIFVNMYFANRTLRFAQRTEIANRFQKGAELLKDSKTVVAGGTMLSQIAIESPKNFLVPTLNALWTVLRAESYDKDKCGTFYGAEGTRPTTISQSAAEVVHCFAVMGQLGGKKGMKGVLQRRKATHFPVHAFALAYCTIEGPYQLSRFEFDYVILEHVRFVNIDFSNCKLRCIVLGELTFEDCNLAGMTLRAMYPDLRPAGQSVVLTNCKNEEKLVRDNSIQPF